MQYVGKPKETSSNTATTLLEIIMERLGETREATVRIVEVPNANG